MFYCSSPDASLKKLLQEIEIPAEKVTFMEEIGEGCFGRVYRGKSILNWFENVINCNLKSSPLTR